MRNPTKYIKKCFHDETIEFSMNFKCWNKDLVFISKKINLLCNNVNQKDLEWKME